LEIYSESKYSDYIWANPIVLCSLYIFVLGFGVTNAGFLLYRDFAFLTDVTGSELYKWANRVVGLSLVSSVGMWLGYRSGIARKLEFGAKNSQLLARLIKTGSHPRWIAIHVSFFVAVVAETYLLSTGILGWYNIPGESVLPYIQFLGLLTSLQYIAPIVVSFWYASTRKEKHLYVAIFFVTVQVLVGLPHGMKEAIIKPLIPPLIAFYIGSKKIPWSGAYASALVFVGSFILVGEMRSQLWRLNSRGSFQAATSVVLNTSPQDYSTTFWETSKSVVTRLNFTGRALAVIESQKNGLDEEAPNFRKKLLLSPAMAVIPRAIWPSKPKNEGGRWAYSEVTGKPVPKFGGFNNTGMTPVAYLFIVGGALLCFLGFFLIGLVQRAVKPMAYTYGIGGLIFFITILSPLVQVDNLFHAALIKIIRFSLIGIVAQFLLLKK